MFESLPFDQMYREFLGPLTRTVLLAMNNGAGFNVYPPRQAWVTAERDSELVSDSSLQDRQLKMVMLADQLPSPHTEMGLKDRVIIGNRFYSVVEFDGFSRAVGGQLLAYNILLRGGGRYVSGGLYTIVSESGDPIITEAGDGMTTE